MRKDLDYLPASKQKDIAHIVAVLRDEFEQVTGFATGKKKHNRILKIILFGSHATGKWVNDPANGYVSDYDILVLLNRSELLTEYKVWNTAEDRIALKVKPPLNILVHTLQEVNEALSQGQYFFTDIQQQGVLLYESDKSELAQVDIEALSQPVAVAEQHNSQWHKNIAEKHYAQWFESANEFFDTFHDDLGKKRLKKAAFELHQATERYYACLLLVLTNYKPNTHNLKQLNSLAMSQNERIAEVFPQESKAHRRRFQLLKTAYVEARYSEHYTITEEELTWLAERVACLQSLTETLCQDRIKSFSTK